MDVGAREVGRHEPLPYLTADLSALAALSHLWTMPEHMREWRRYGAFFVVSAVALRAYGTILTRWPRRSLFLVGIGGNVLILALYLLTRTVRIPLLGPHAGELEGFGPVDLCIAASELEIILSLGMLLTEGLFRERKLQVVIFVTTAALLVGHLVHLLAERTTPGHGT